jgi:Fe-S-cluster containining protein
MQTLRSILEQLAHVYRRMDAAYEQTAQAYGFVCRGCEENCCRSRFFHHTLIEHLMLHDGLARLPSAQRDAVIQSAAAICRADTAEQSVGRLCALNQAERCILYAWRPMICRLHGVPHRLQLPDGRFQTGPGCAAFERNRTAAITGQLDRTPLYQALAELEQAARRIAGWAGKRRMTIAEMIVTPAVRDPDDMDCTSP